MPTKNKKDSLDLFIQFLINTGKMRSRRTLSLVGVAKLIRELYDAYGGEEEFLKEFNQKKSYVRRYLKAEKLVSYVRKLVEDRVIDKIGVVNEISKFKPEDQGLVANAYLSFRKLTVREMRNIRDWRKYNNKSIRECIEEFYEGRDGINFGILNLDSESKIEEGMEEKLKCIFGKGLVEYKVGDPMFNVVLNDYGCRALRVMAKMKSHHLRYTEGDMISYLLCRRRGLLKLSGELSEKIMGKGGVD